MRENKTHCDICKNEFKKHNGRYVRKTGLNGEKLCYNCWYHLTPGGERQKERSRVYNHLRTERTIYLKGLSADDLLKEVTQSR